MNNLLVVKIAKVIAFFVILSVANRFYPSIRFLLQGVLLIAFWGNWLHTNDDWPFAQENGKYFNWIGALAIANGIIHLL